MAISHFVLCNGLAIWHGFPYISHIKGNNDHKSAILNFIELKCFRAYPSLTPHIFFDSDGLANCDGFPVITHIKVNNDRKLAIFNLIPVEFFSGHILPGMTGPPNSFTSP